MTQNTLFLEELFTFKQRLLCKTLIGCTNSGCRKGLGFEELVSKVGDQVAPVLTPRSIRS